MATVMAAAVSTIVVVIPAVMAAPLAPAVSVSIVVPVIFVPAVTPATISIAMATAITISIAIGRGVGHCCGEQHEDCKGNCNESLGEHGFSLLYSESVTGVVTGLDFVKTEGSGRAEREGKTGIYYRSHASPSRGADSKTLFDATYVARDRL
jgi:hypothetical protein